MIKDDMSYEDYMVYLKQKYPMSASFAEVSSFVLLFRKIKHLIKKGSCGFIGENCNYCGRKLPPEGIR